MYGNEGFYSYGGGFDAIPAWDQRGAGKRYRADHRSAGYPFFNQRPARPMPPPPDFYNRPLHGHPSDFSSGQQFQQMQTATGFNQFNGTAAVGQYNNRTYTGVINQSFAPGMGIGNNSFHNTKTSYSRHAGKRGSNRKGRITDHIPIITAADHELKQQILQKFSECEGQSMKTNDIVRLVDCAEKTHVNRILYGMEKEGLLKKIQISPPVWMLCVPSSLVSPFSEAGAVQLPTTSSRSLLNGPSFVSQSSVAAFGTQKGANNHSASLCNVSVTGGFQSINSTTCVNVVSVTGVNNIVNCGSGRGVERAQCEPTIGVFQDCSASVSQEYERISDSNTMSDVHSETGCVLNVNSMSEFDEVTVKSEKEDNPETCKFQRFGDQLQMYRGRGRGRGIAIKKSIKDEPVSESRHCVGLASCTNISNYLYANTNISHLKNCNTDAGIGTPSLLHATDQNFEDSITDVPIVQGDSQCRPDSNQDLFHQSTKSDLSSLQEYVNSSEQLHVKLASDSNSLPNVPDCKSHPVSERPFKIPLNPPVSVKLAAGDNSAFRRPLPPKQLIQVDPVYAEFSNFSSVACADVSKFSDDESYHSLPDDFGSLSCVVQPSQTHDLQRSQSWSKDLKSVAMNSHDSNPFATALGISQNATLSENLFGMNTFNACESIACDAAMASSSMNGVQPANLPILTGESFAALSKNSVSALMEYAQSRHIEVEIKCINSYGPPHRPV